MANNSANQWYISFLANRPVEIKRKLTHSLTSDGYAVRIGRLISNEIINGSHYRINAFFYDRSTSQMFGRPCHTNWVQAENLTCEFYEELFFHCPNLDEKILIVFEYIEKESEKSLGWSKRPVHIPNEAMYELLKVPPEIMIKSLEVHAGTPKVLVFGADVVKNTIGDVELQVYLHPPVLNVSNYFPEFCIVSGLDDIPGITAHNDEPFLHDPHTEPVVSASLDEINLVFGPNASKIEKIIIDEVLHDWNLKENTVGVTGKTVKIVERRLKIGVHNGFSYLTEPLSINLNASNSNILSNTSSLKKRRALSANDLRNGPVSLFVNSRVSIPNICEDPRVALIFLVEYTFSHEDDRTFSQPILIGWGAWKPFAEDNVRQHVQATVSLVGGPRPNPEGVLCFRNLLHLHQRDDSVFTESQPQITINFSFFLEQLRSESRYTTLGDVSGRKLTSERVTRKEKSPEPQKKNEDEETRIMTLPKIDTSRSITSEDELKAIDENLSKFISQDKEEKEITPIVEEIRSEVYSLPTDRPSNFARNVHSLFARLDFHQIKDRNGESPQTEDVNLKILSNLTVEKHDRLDMQQVLFQFIGLKMFNSENTLNKAFFTLNFYRFPDLTTESLFLKQYDKAEPAALVRADNKPGFIAKYVMDSEEDRIDFIDFLSTGHATIQIWDSDSLLLIGSCVVPLNNLMRRGKEAVQLFVQCPLFGEGSRPMGLLCLKLANIGFPSAHRNDTMTMAATGSGMVTRRLVTSKSLADEGPHTYRIHAKPLRTAQSSGLEKFLNAQRLDIQQRHEQIFNEDSFEKLKKWNKLKNDFDFDSKKEVTQKFIFEEELAAYKKLRYESKQAKLLEAVFKGITIQHELKVQFGEKHFFEFPLENTSSEPVNCSIEMDDEALNVVEDLEDWKFYKTQYKLSTPLEKNMLGANRQLFLKPGETLFVPFVYDSFYIQNDTFDMYSSKIVFRRIDTQEPISILDLHIYRRNQLINHVCCFYEESLKNINRKLTVPKEIKRIMSVRCSDPSVKMAIRNHGIQQIMDFTTYSGENGDRKNFFILMYNDHLHSKLAQVWKITLISFGRIDIRTVAGQMTKHTLRVQRRSNLENVDDLLRAYSSIGNGVLQESTILADRQPIVKMQFVLNFIGSRIIYISVVNTNSKKLEAGYMMHTTCEAPRITQKYIVDVRINEEKMAKKKIAIRNPYGLPRTFQISTSRPDIVKISENVINVPAQGSKNTELFFSKISHKPMNFETLLFVSNSETNVQEEAFCIIVKFI